MDDQIATAGRGVSARFSSTHQPVRRGRGIARVGSARQPANRVVVMAACSGYWIEQQEAGQFPPPADNSPMVQCHACGTFTPRPAVSMRYGIGLSTDRSTMTTARSNGEAIAVRNRLISGGAASVVIAMIGFCPECDMVDPEAIVEPPNQLDYRIKPATLAHLK